ncbi:hypothetical protein, partial [Helicobacter sp. T3_23-1059]
KKMSIAHGGDITAGRGGSAYATNAAQFATNAIQAGNNATQSLTNATTAFREKFKADDERAIFKQKMAHADKEMALKEHEINTNTALAREKMDFEKYKYNTTGANLERAQAWNYTATAKNTNERTSREVLDKQDSYRPTQNARIDSFVMKMERGEPLTDNDINEIDVFAKELGQKIPYKNGKKDYVEFLKQRQMQYRAELKNAQNEYFAQNQNPQSYAMQNPQNQTPSLNLGGGVHIKYENGQIKRNGEIISQNDKRYFDYAQKLGINPQTSFNRQ